jgi:hypothetical protein
MTHRLDPHKRSLRSYDVSGRLASTQERKDEPEVVNKSGFIGDCVVAADNRGRS